MSIKIKIERVIKIKTFKNILQQEKNKISKGQIKSTKRMIDFLFRVIAPIVYRDMDKIKGVSEEEKISRIAYIAEASVQRVLRKYLEQVTNSFPTEADTHLLNVYQKLAYDRNRRKEVYNKIKDMPTNKLEKKKVDNNFKRNEELIVRQILYLYRTKLEQIPQDDYKIAKNYKNNKNVRKKAEELLSKEELEVLKQEVKFVGKEDQNFEDLFPEFRRVFLEEIRKQYINTLIEIGNILRGFGLIHDYEDRENNRLKELNIDEKINIDDYFNREYLQNLPIQTLMAMNIFWSNRLTKEMNKINNAAFILKDMSFIEKILKDEKRYNKFPFENLPDEDIEAELLKTGVLSEISQMCVDNVYADLEQDNINETVKKVDLKKYLPSIVAEYQQEYCEYFNSSTPMSTNVLGDDIVNKYITGKNIVYNLYTHKNSNVLALVESCLTRDAIQNWGYIEDDTSSVGNFIILGFDIPNLNMPLRIHIPKKYIKEYLLANNMENIVPVYKGNDDFRKYGYSIKTPALIPMTSTEKNQIKSMKIDGKNGVQKSMCLEHLKYLADTKIETFPQRLKTPRVIGKGKKQKVKYVFEKEYINLDTNARYRKDKDGSYVEIQSQKEER